MGKLVVALASGIVFGLGLAISSMVNPAKVLGFLDVAGAWDPSLAFVLGGAVAVAFVAFRLIDGRRRPVLAPRFAGASASGIDRRLVGGSLLFGVGWGLVGLCPGPAIASLAYGRVDSVIFVAAMAVGAAAFNFLPGPASPRGGLASET